MLSVIACLSFRFSYFLSPVSFSSFLFLFHSLTSLSASGEVEREREERKWNQLHVQRSKEWKCLWKTEVEEEIANQSMQAPTLFCPISLAICELLVIWMMYRQHEQRTAWLVTSEWASVCLFTFSFYLKPPLPPDRLASSARENKKEWSIQQDPLLQLQFTS